MIISLSETKEYLGLAGTTGNDTLLTALITRVSSWMERLLGRKIESGSVTEYFDGGSNEIMLNNFPVSAVTTVKYNAGTQSAPSWQTIAAANYTAYLSEGIVKHSSVFPEGNRNIEVVYTAGFVAIPGDIALLALELVGRVFNARKAQGMKSESLGSARIDWNSELTEEQKMIIGSYRKIRV